MSLIFHPYFGKAPDRVVVPNDEIVLKGDLRKTVVLVHGLTGTPNEMRHLAFTLNKKGYSVVCPRLANHGQPLRILKRTRWEEFYESLRTVFLKAAETGDRVYVAGLSMSALFVLLLAEEFGEQLSGGVCYAPTLFFDGWNVPWYNRLLPLAKFTPFEYSIYFREDPPYGIKNERMRAMVHRYFSKAKIEDIDGISKFGYAFFPIALFRQLRLLADRIVPMLGKVTTPMLLVHPEQDDTASLRNSQMIFDGISSPVKKLVVLKDSYHVITADQERDLVAQETLKFLEAI